MAKGDSKSNPIVDATVTITSDAKPPTDLNIVRNGATFTFEWKNTATYSSIKFKWREQINNKWGAWSSIASLSTSATKRTFNPTLTNNRSLTAVQALISVDQATTSTTKTYKSGKKWHKQTVKKVYNNTAVNLVRTISIPYYPTPGSITEGQSSTSFAYSVAGAGASDFTIFNAVKYNVGHMEGWGDKDPASFTGWGAEQTLTTASGTIPEGTGGAVATGGASVTSMVRMKSVGPTGESTYKYNKFVYARPYQAKSVAVTKMANRSTGMDVTVSWTKNADGLHPSKQHKVEWYIGTPASTGWNPPTGVSWETGIDYEDDRPGNAQAVTFYVNKRMSSEECLWVRVWQKWVLNLETVSENGRALPAGGIVPAAPTISDVDYDATSRAFSISLTNNSSLPDCDVSVAVYRKRDNKLLASYRSWSPSGTLYLDSETCVVKAQAAFSVYNSAITVYEFEPTVICSNPNRYYPTSVRATAGSAAGSAQVTWVNTMRNVTKAKVAVYTSPTGESIDTAEVTGANVTSATVYGLQYGVPYYFRVSTTNAAGDSDYSTTYGACTLSAGSVTPNLSLSEDASHNIVVTWGWATWAATQRIELEWDDEDQKGDSNTDTEGEATIERNGRGGNGTYIIKGLKRGKTWYVWARYNADNAWTNRARAAIALNVTPINPTNITFQRAPQVTDEEGKSTVRLSWSNNWNDTDTTEVSWSDNINAWNTTDGAKTSTLEGRPSTILIPGLDLGRVWYARVKFKFEEFETADMSPVALDLRTTPSTPKVMLSAYDIYQYGKTDISWTYSNEDLSEQASAVVTVKDSNGNTVGTLTALAEHAITLYAEDMGLPGNADYTVSVRTISGNGMQSAASESVGFHVNVKPEATITSTSLVERQIGEEGEEITVDALTELPLEVTVSGAEHAGHVQVYIERSKAILLARPDETTQHGYEGELIAVKEGGSDGIVTFTMDDLRTPFEDMSEYRIVAVVIDQFGSSDPVTKEFTCVWDHQAIVPVVAIQTDPDEYITKLTVTQPEGEVAGGDTFDIYRLSADKPELIVRDGVWGTTYVDPYPALGDNAGHRVVYRTNEGDYTTADGGMAWVDVDGSVVDPESDAEPYFYGDKVLIDFDNNRIELDYNLTVSSSWEKDFTETKYLGGSVQGDWNPAVSRTGSINTVMLATEDTGEIAKMRRLAAWPGVCHVRTPDGSSFAADIQVSEDRSHDNAGKIVSFQTEITRVDAEALEGMTLAEWEGTDELE